MERRPVIESGDRVVLTEDAREWFRDIGTRVGHVVIIDGTWPVIEWPGLPMRVRIRPDLLELME